MRDRIQHLERPTVYAGIVYVLIVAYGLRWLYFYWSAAPAQIVVTPADDAYYYFEIAYNLLRTGTLTVDRIHSTNGFHPLWLVTILPIFVFEHEKLLLVRWIGSLSTLILTICFLFAAHYLIDRYDRPTSTVAISGFLLYSLQFWRQNVESAVAIPSLILTVWYVDRTSLLDVRDAEYRVLVAGGLLLSLTQFARLDAVFLTFVVLCTALYQNRRHLLQQEVLYGFVALFSPPAVTGFAYVSYNYVTFGYVRPVSSVVKSMRDPAVWYNPWAVQQYSRLLQGHSIQATEAAAELSLIALSVAFAGFVFARSETIPADLQAGAVASAFVSLQMTYYFVFYSSTIAAWYTYSLFSSIVFVVPAALRLVQKRVDIPSGTISRGNALKVFVVLIFATAILFNPYIPSDPAAERNFKYNTYELTGHTSTYDDDAIFAMGDQAGVFAFYTQHRVIHLEGLANNYEIVGYMRNGTIESYLVRENVDYLVDVEVVDKDAGKQEISVTHPAKIYVSRVSVYSDCLVFSSIASETAEAALGRYIWSMDCLREKPEYARTGR